MVTAAEELNPHCRRGWDFGAADWSRPARHGPIGGHSRPTCAPPPARAQVPPDPFMFSEEKGSASPLNILAADACVQNGVKPLRWLRPLRRPSVPNEPASTSEPAGSCCQELHEEGARPTPRVLCAPGLVWPPAAARHCPHPRGWIAPALICLRSSVPRSDISLEPEPF